MKRHLRRLPGWLILVQFRSSVTRFSIYLSGRWRDFRFGIETSGTVGYDGLDFGADRGNIYEASPWRVVHLFLNSRPIKQTDVFLDLGSGKGRAVIAAAQHPFKRVIGVELSSSLNSAAKRNVAKVDKHLACHDVEIVTADITNYEIPDDVTFVYIFNTIQGERFHAVVDQICHSASRSPRVIALAYYCAEMADDLIARGFTEVTTSPHLRLFQYEA